MKNHDLENINRDIEEAAGFKKQALEAALRHRAGWRRSVHLWFARFFERMERLGKRIREDELNGWDD